MSISPRVVVLATALVLASCGSNKSVDKASAPAGQDTTKGQSAAISGDADRKTVLAAVEPFEALAETAFGATPSALDSSIAAVMAAADAIKPVVSADVSARLQRHVLAITLARKADNRADIALASIEGFREVVGATPGRALVPADVSLLDYAGLRYDSEVQASPPRWADMPKATAYARERVAALKAQPIAANLLPEVDAAITAMDVAITARDVAGARAAAKLELDLVDKLELAFAPTK